MAKNTNYVLGKNRKNSYTRPKPPLGPYTKPRLTAIKLDPEQAILTSCRVGGAYMIAGTVCFGGGLSLLDCASHIRGAVIRVGTAHTFTYRPS